MRAMSLNPYFNGKYFLREDGTYKEGESKVLILILMENTF